MSIAPGKKTRRSQRVATRFLMNVLSEAHGEKTKHPVWALEMSPLGAKIRSDAPFVVGQAVELVPAEGRSYALTGQIVWVSSTKPAEWYAGIEFTRPWTD